MNKLRPLPGSIAGKGSFSRREFVKAMIAEYDITEPQVAYDLNKRLEKGEIARAGWGRYSLSRKTRYIHEYSREALDVARELGKNYDGLEFQIFELRQLNTFMNHQMAHNTIFVSIENDLATYVFDSLWNAYPGRVMLKPKVSQYYRYRQDDGIVVLRLPSESPKGYEQPWQSRIEKILVDVFTDRLVSEIVPDGEKKAIIEGVFNEYLIDENTILHYARRKGAEKKMKRVLSDCGKEYLA